MTQLFKGTFLFRDMLPRPKYPNKLAVKQKVIQSDKEMINIKHKTRLQSSWMRTPRLLTVS